MDLKYNLPETWLLRDRSPLPVTTLEVIKDFPEFVTAAFSRNLECYTLSLFFSNQFFTRVRGGAACVAACLWFSE